MICLRTVAFHSVDPHILDAQSDRVMGLPKIRCDCLLPLLDLQSQRRLPRLLLCDQNSSQICTRVPVNKCAAFTWAT